MKQHLHYQAPKIEELILKKCDNLSSTLSAPGELYIEHTDVEDVDVWQ